MGLCELASNEQDQKKLEVLFEGILRLLEDRQAQVNTAADRSIVETRCACQPTEKQFLSEQAKRQCRESPSTIGDPFAWTSLC